MSVLASNGSKNLIKFQTQTITIRNQHAIYWDTELIFTIFYAKIKFPNVCLWYIAQSRTIGIKHQHVTHCTMKLSFDFKFFLLKKCIFSWNQTQIVGVKCQHITHYTTESSDGLNTGISISTPGPNFCYILYTYCIQNNKEAIIYGISSLSDFHGT